MTGLITGFLLMVCGFGPSTSAYTSSQPPLLTVQPAVAAVGDSAAVGFALDDQGYAYSLCDYYTCDASVFVIVYGPDGAVVGINEYENGPDQRYLPEDLADSVKLSSFPHLADGLYTVKVDTFADEIGDPPSSTTTSATFSLTWSPAPKLRRTVSHFGAHGWKIVGTLLTGGHAYARQNVSIRVHIPGLGWNALKTKKTNRRGQVVFTSEPRPGAGRYKAELFYGEDGAHVRSKPFDLYRRP